MSLSLILGHKDLEKWLEYYKSLGYRYMSSNDAMFDDLFEKSWFQDPLIREIMDKVDNIDRVNGSALHNRITGDTHAPQRLSTGCKTTILVYKFPKVIFRARMGDNCTPFIEKIASRQDVILHSCYVHSYRFQFISEIYFVNFDKTVYNWLELMNGYTPFEYFEKHGCEMPPGYMDSCYE